MDDLGCETISHVRRVRLARLRRCVRIERFPIQSAGNMGRLAAILPHLLAARGQSRDRARLEVQGGSLGPGAGGLTRGPSRSGEVCRSHRNRIETMAAPILLHKIAHSLRRYRLVERRRVSLEISLDSGAFDGDADWLAADQTSPGGARQSGARKRSPWAPLSIGCPSGCARPCSGVITRAAASTSWDDGSAAQTSPPASSGWAPWNSSSAS